MSIEDFSHEFDILLNSYDTSIGVTLNEYEKSVFLTKAQEEYVIGLYTGKNVSGESFEETEEMRRYLSEIVEEAIINPISTTNGKPLGVDSKSKFFTLPDNLWFITYEAVAVEGDECMQGFSLMVIPVRQDEYQKLKKNPFRGANDRRALRFDLSENNVEIVCKYPVTQYYVRYLRKLQPIVLADFRNDGVTVNGVAVPTECELHESLHRDILERAVVRVLQSKGYTRNNENK